MNAEEKIAQAAHEWGWSPWRVRRYNNSALTEYVKTGPDGKQWRIEITFSSNSRVVNAALQDVTTWPSTTAAWLSAKKKDKLGTVLEWFLTGYDGVGYPTPPNKGVS